MVLTHFEDSPEPFTEAATKAPPKASPGKKMAEREEDDDAQPPAEIKRGRGRPPKDPAQKKELKEKASPKGGAKKSVGRPRKTEVHRVWV